jgi:hypothetical protein
MEGCLRCNGVEYGAGGKSKVVDSWPGLYGERYSAFQTAWYEWSNSKRSYHMASSSEAECSFLLTHYSSLLEELVTYDHVSW